MFTLIENAFLKSITDYDYSPSENLDVLYIIW